MDDNKQKINNNVVANAQPPALIKKYKRARPHRGPVSISVAITPSGDLPRPRRFSTVIVASRYGITSYSVLSAHSMSPVPPHRSLPLLSLSLLPSFLSPSHYFSPFFSLPSSTSLFLSISSSRIYLIWADCTTTAIKRLARLRHFQILTGRRSTLYNSRQKRGSYRAVSCFWRRGRNVTFLVCRNAHLIPRSCPTANFEIFYN